MLCYLDSQSLRSSHKAADITHLIFEKYNKLKKKLKNTIDIK